MKSLLNKKDHQRRYYLHSKIKQSYLANTRGREVSVPANEVDEAKCNKYINELIDRFGYNIQISIV